jgi:hypothetical protein
MHSLQDVVPTSVTFFGNAAPASGELSVTVKGRPTKPISDSNHLTLSVPNVCETDLDNGRRYIFEAARKLIKAYMLKQEIALEYLDGPNLPYITKISYEGDISLPTIPLK